MKTFINNLSTETDEKILEEMYAKRIQESKAYEEEHKEKINEFLQENLGQSLEDFKKEALERISRKTN